MSDKQRIKCPDCGKSLAVPRAVIGRRIKCPACETVFPAKARAEKKPGPEARKRKKIARTEPDSGKGNTNHPDSILGDLMAEGAPIWIKIAGGALATPIAVVWGMARARRGGAVVLPQNPVVLVLGLIVCLLVGALLGVGLSLKDVVENRLAANKPVALPLKLLFGLGVRSLLIWIPLIMFLSLAYAIFG